MGLVDALEALFFQERPGLSQAGRYQNVEVSLAGRLDRVQALRSAQEDRLGVQLPDAVPYQGVTINLGLFHRRPFLDRTVSDHRVTDHVHCRRLSAPPPLPTAWVRGHC